MQAMNLTLVRQDDSKYKMVENTTQEVVKARSVVHCGITCMEILGSGCKSFAYMKDRIPQCLMSSEYLVTDTDLENIMSLSVVDYNLYSEGKPIEME